MAIHPGVSRLWLRLRSQPDLLKSFSSRPRHRLRGPRSPLRPRPAVSSVPRTVLSPPAVAWWSHCSSPPPPPRRNWARMSFVQLLRYHWGCRAPQLGNSRHWTTSHRRSTVVGILFHWDRGSCTWSVHRCRHYHRCETLDTRPQHQRSNLPPPTHRTQRLCQAPQQRWGSHHQEHQGSSPLETPRPPQQIRHRKNRNQSQKLRQVLPGILHYLLRILLLTRRRRRCIKVGPLLNISHLHHLQSRSQAGIEPGRRQSSVWRRARPDLLRKSLESVITSHMFLLN